MLESNLWARCFIQVISLLLMKTLEVIGDEETKYYVEPSGIIPEGTTYVTIYYGDASTKLDISTTGTFELYVVQVPVKTDYTVGDFFDPTGLILGYRSGDTTKEIPNFKKK